jgi:outer membrane protein
MTPRIKTLLVLGLTGIAIYAASGFADVAPAQHLYGLDECFEASIRRSESIASDDESIIQAEEKYRQAIGSILPQLNGVGTYYQQQLPTNSFGAQISPANQSTLKLTATQYLFQGLREYATLRQDKLLKSAQEDAKRQALIALFETAAQSYYNVLSAERQVADLRSEMPYYNQWIAELRNRIAIGRSQEQEVLTVQAQVASLQATLESSLLAIQVNREAFSFITGLPQDTPLVDDVNLEKPITNLPDALEVIPRRPEVTGQIYTRQAAEEGVNIAWEGNLPTLSLNGDYYFATPQGYENGSKWDFQLTLTIPIFSGGVIQSQVRTAASQERQSELTLSLNKRTIDQNIRTIYASAVSDRAQFKALKLAKEVSYKDYEAEKRDYRLGLVANIDVLQALTTFQEAERAMDVARYTAMYDYGRLQAETGKVTGIVF